MSYNNDKFSQNIQSPSNRNDQNFGSKEVLCQNSQDIYNEGKIPDESFNFQGFFENDMKQMNNLSLNGDLKNQQNIKSPKKTKRESFKNDNMTKKIKRKPNDRQNRHFLRFFRMKKNNLFLKGLC